MWFGYDDSVDTVDDEDDRLLWDNAYNRIVLGRVLLIKNFIVYDHVIMGMLGYV